MTTFHRRQAIRALESAHVRNRRLDAQDAAVRRVYWIVLSLVGAALCLVMWLDAA